MTLLSDPVFLPKKPFLVPEIFSPFNTLKYSVGSIQFR